MYYFFQHVYDLKPTAVSKYRGTVFNDYQKKMKLPFRIIITEHNVHNLATTTNCKNMFRLSLYLILGMRANFETESPPFTIGLHGGLSEKE